MDVDHILATMNDCQVEYLLIGGMNFLLRHEPVLTFDVDLWIDDQAANRRRCERALSVLEAEWGESDSDWGKVAQRDPGWLDRQPVFCLSSPSGAIDIFRSVRGLWDWATSRARVARYDGKWHRLLGTERRRYAAMPAGFGGTVPRKLPRIETLERVLREQNRGDHAGLDGK